MNRVRNASTRIVVVFALGVIAGGVVAWFALPDRSLGAGSSQAAQPATIEQAAPSMVASFPALGRPLDLSEAQQLPAVAQVITVLASQREPNTGGANSALARRIWQAAEDAEYLVPGNGVLCMVSIVADRPSGGGCAPASSVEGAGTTSLTVLPAGYVVSAILPRGTNGAVVTDALGRTTTLSADPDRTVHLVSSVPLARLSYDVPGGGQHVGSLELPPSPHAPPPAW
jgi:hypothetical protein